MPDATHHELRLDVDSCMGHGRCYAAAPDLFDADDAGHAVLLTVVVPIDALELARLAEASCPEKAISVVEVAAP